MEWTETLPTTEGNAWLYRRIRKVDAKSLATMAVAPSCVVEVVEILVCFVVWTRSVLTCLGKWPSWWFENGEKSIVCRSSLQVPGLTINTAFEDGLYFGIPPEVESPAFDVPCVGILIERALFLFANRTAVAARNNMLTRRKDWGTRAMVGRNSFEYR